jgi:hypothetical protein
LEVFRFSPPEGCSAIAPCVASAQAMRSRRLSSASKSPDCVVAHRSDRCSSLVRPVVPTGQTGLELLQHRLRFSGLGFVDQPRNQWFSGEPLETPQTRCSLRQSPLMTRLPRSPGSTLVLRLNQEIVHDFILLFMPPCGPHLTPLATGSSNESYLSSPHLEASPATTFCTCSSPAPTPVKLQPAPPILRQESVHTTLSITHHTRKRPSTGPRTTHGSHGVDQPKALRASHLQNKKRERE